jgi:hypothetical protein
MRNFFENALGVGVVLAIVAVVLAIPTALVTISGFQGYGHGQQTAYVTAIEQYGTIWKTTRVYVKSDLAASKEDVYCVIDPTVISQLQKAADDQSRVKLGYTDQGITFNWQCGSEESTVTTVTQ